MAAALSLMVIVVVILVDANAGKHSLFPLIVAAALAAAGVALTRALRTEPSLRIVEMGLVAALIWFVTAR